jgi:hypothetical protein
MGCIAAVPMARRPTPETDAPTDDEPHALLQTVITRLMKILTRRGVLVEDIGQSYLAEPDADGEESRTLRPLQAAAIAYCIAFGPCAGQKALTLRGATPREAPARQPLCADIDGFSLHAAVRLEADDLILPPYLRTHPIRNVTPLPGRLSGVPGRPDAAGTLGVSAFSTTSADAPR